ncbi:MAG: thioredoxin family protein [Methylophilaceae bacterium]|nr:MAG: thioredoxin family protein [Methylophilaceae bacterium]
MLTLFPIKLYTTSNCHLCEQAVELLTQAKLTKQLVLVEIVDDALLLAMYGTRIPVLQRTDTTSELDWPFSVDTIIKFMNAST